MYPAWAIELYASIRLSERCASAIRFPTTIEAIASAATTGCHRPMAAGNASIRTRTSAAKAAALTPVAMKPVTGVGEPS